MFFSPIDQVQKYYYKDNIVGTRDNIVHLDFAPFVAVGGGSSSSTLILLEDPASPDR